MSKSKIIIITAILFFIGIAVGGLFTAFVMQPGDDAAQNHDESEHDMQGVTQTTSEDGTQLWTCGMHPEVIMEEPGNCPKCGMNLVPLKTSIAGSGESTKPKGERKILYWQAPMNPTEIYDSPGKSNMGMDLVPVYEDAGTLGAGGSITIDPTTVQNMGVRTTKVTKSDFSHSIRTVGKVVYDEEKLFTVTTKISGWIEKLQISYTGQEVKKGDPLLEIYSPELVTTQEEYLLALNTHKLVSNSSFESVRDGAESLLNSTRKRLLYWDIPKYEIEQLEKTGEVRKTIQLESPTDGVVIHKTAIEGMHVKEGQNLYQIADLSKVWVNVSVYDNEIPWVKEHQEAEMELSYLPGKTYYGKVTYIYPYLNAKARDVQVRLEFDNPGLELKPEMYANIKLKSMPIVDALTIPNEAVLRSGERDLVFVVRDGGRFEPREIRIGAEGEGGRVHVLSGLFEGEQIVISAQFMLDSESRLQEAIQKMLQEKRERKQKQAGEAENSNAEKQDEKPKESSKMDMKKMDGADQSKMDHSKMEHEKQTDQASKEMEHNQS